MTSCSAPTTRPGRAEPVESAVVCDDRAVLQALESACHLHEGPVTVLELVWAWTADLWWNAITDLQIDAMALPHTPGPRPSSPGPPPAHRPSGSRVGDLQRNPVPLAAHRRALRCKQ